jgi:hypothetical protein
MKSGILTHGLRLEFIANQGSNSGAADAALKKFA